MLQGSFIPGNVHKQRSVYFKMSHKHIVLRLSHLSSVEMPVSSAFHEAFGVYSKLQSDLLREVVESSAVRHLTFLGRNM